MKNKTKPLLFLLFLIPLAAASQISLDKIDTSRSSLQGIDTLKSCELVKNTLQSFFKNGDAELISTNCDLPIVIEQQTYSSRTELVKFLRMVITAASKSTANPYAKNAWVLGRRREVLNGFLTIDFIYVVGVVEFNVNGQTSNKLALFAIRNPVNPSIAGMHIE